MGRMDLAGAGYRTLRLAASGRCVPEGGGVGESLSETTNQEESSMQVIKGCTHSKAGFGKRRNDCGTAMEAELFGAEKAALKAAGKSPPASRPSWWGGLKGLSAGIQTFAENYMVQGHLLNHHIGGGDNMDNLTPITKSANTTMLNYFEKDAKSAIEAGDNIRYSVTADYSGGAPTAAALGGTKLSTADQATLNGSGYMDYFCRWVRANTDVYAPSGALKSSTPTLWVSNEAA
ncbi:hypothetical protein CEK28_10380 [Xenophilus sp. AP218F]|nr:hypothetical protein CEK28_10380 [Xenophilus sp. AP218F]